MAITDSVANFVDRLRADVAQQEYWNSQVALNSLQNQSTSDPSVVQRIQEETKAQQDAALRYMQRIDAQSARSGKDIPQMPASIEAAMGQQGGTPLRPVRREAPDMSKGDYSYAMTPEEEKKYAFAAPPRVVSRKQFKTEEEYQAWLASRPKTDEEMLKTPKSEAGATVYGENAPETQAAPAKPEAEFAQASNRGAKNALDVSDMGFGQPPKQQKRPADILRELERSGHHLDAQDFRYRLEQADLEANIKAINRQARQIAETQGDVAAKHFVDLYLPLAKEQAKTKPIEETEYFKAAKEELYNSESRKTFGVLSNLRNELIDGQRMLDAGRKDQAVIYFKANVPKVLNFLSTYSPDALQDPEVTRLIPELQNFVDKGINPVEWAKKIQDTGVLGSFTRDPYAFLKKAQALYNAAAKAQNKKFDIIKGRVGESASQRLRLDQEKFQLFPSELSGGMMSRPEAVERGIAPQTTAPSGAARKSVSIQSIYPQ